MKNLDPNALFAQAKKMREQMSQVEDDLKERMVEGKAGNGLVSVVANGNREVCAVRIQPDAIDPGEPEELEDLVLVAVKQALDKARALHDQEMEKLSGGMGLPPGML